MVEVVSVEASLVVARPVEGGYTWTLASRLGRMLVMAQEIFGPRDKAYTILGVEFAGDTPQVWFPGDRGDVVVQLTEGSLSDVERACYQLAHESIHLLAPTGKAGATNLEEGMATWFATHYMTDAFVGGERWKPDIASYFLSHDMITTLMEREPTAIRRARQQEPTISQITPDLLREVCPFVGVDAEFLCRKFVR